MLRTGEVGDIGITVFPRRSDAELLAAGDVGVEGFPRFLGENNRFNTAIGTDANVIRATNIDRMEEVRDDVFVGGNGRRSDQVRHEVDAEVASAIGECLEDVVGLIARMGVNGGASGVGNEYGLGRGSYGVGGSAVAAVAHVERDTELVHLLRGKAALPGETGVLCLETTIAKFAAQVVRELHDAHAKTAEGCDAGEIFFEEVGVLEAREDSDPVGFLAMKDIGWLANEEVNIGIGVDGGLELGDGFDGAFESTIGDRVMNGGESGAANLLEGVFGELSVIADEGGSAEGVNHEGILVESGEVGREVGLRE